MITMVTCCAQTPAIFVTLRCVNEDERPIAMGCQYLLLRLIAYIPVSYLVRLSAKVSVKTKFVVMRGQNGENHKKYIKNENIIRSIVLTALK